jgi:hypothetical protein
MTNTGAPRDTAEPRIRIGPNTHVQVMLISEQGAPETLEFDVVPDSEADFVHGFLGISTPLAHAIVGHAKDEVVPYRAEDVTAVRIVKVTPSAATPPANVQAERQAVIEKAVAQSEVLNDAAFALAAGSKWGDYDPAATVTEVMPAAAKAKVARKRGRRSP